MKTDWIITGPDGQSVIFEGGSMRCQLTGTKLMLWNARDNLVNAEIIASVKLSHLSTNVRAGFVLRSDLTGSNCYYLRITVASGKKSYYLYRVIDGVYTNIGTVDSIDDALIYTKIRFRVDGNQISIEEYRAGNWELIKVCTDTYVTDGGYAGLKSNSATSSYYILYDDVTILEKD